MVMSGRSPPILGLLPDTETNETSSPEIKHGRSKHLSLIIMQGRSDIPHPGQV